MAYADALQDTVTIYTTTTGFKGGDTVGEQVKTDTPLYSGVPCRLMSVSSFQGIRSQIQKQEGYKNKWLIQMEPQYNGADRGATAEVNGNNYIISKKHEIRGVSSAIHHVVYFLEEKE